MKSFPRTLAATLLAAAAVPCLAAPPEEVEGMSPSDALQKLMDGNARFVAGEMQHPNRAIEFREGLTEGQAPFAVILGCADSRVSPELLFDTGPGDLFVIRVAGNSLNDYEKASIEYAVAKLGTPLVMVLGHQSCGAVGAAVAAEKGEASFDGHIHVLVEDLRESVEAAMKNHDAADGSLLDAAVDENARRVKHQLSRSQPYIGTYAEEGKIELVAARYDLDSGEVTRVDEDGHPAHTDHDHDHHGHE